MGILYLVTGPRGSGKTSFCEALAVNLSRRGVNVLGFLQKSERNSQGLPQKLHAVALDSGERRLLAEREGSHPFRFDTAVFAWMDDRLRSALKNGASPLFVDEVGPLEILEGKGLWAPLEILLREYRHPLILSVRQSLLSRLDDLLSAEAEERPMIRRIEVEAIKDAVDAAESIDYEIFCHCQG
jgi:nucleoside-triphosphatase THEP1